MAKLMFPAAELISPAAEITRFATDLIIPVTKVMRFATKLMIPATKVTNFATKLMIPAANVTNLATISMQRFVVTVLVVDAVDFAASTAPLVNSEEQEVVKTIDGLLESNATRFVKNLRDEQVIVEIIDIVLRVEQIDQKKRVIVKIVTTLLQLNHFQ